jgi:hypothetical protein
MFSGGHRDVSRGFNIWLKEMKGLVIPPLETEEVGTLLYRDLCGGRPYVPYTLAHD